MTIAYNMTVGCNGHLHGIDVELDHYYRIWACIYVISVSCYGDCMISTVSMVIKSSSSVFATDASA